MPDVHPTAVVSPEAVLGRDCVVGPFCVVEPGARIGDRCRLAGHVVVKERTTIGSDNEICEAAVLGARPQHVKRDSEPGDLTIGDGNTIREMVTIHRALSDGETTTVGHGNLIMVAAHVAHDCRVGNYTIIANNVMLAGHITVGDRAYLSGAVAVHQFCRIGAYAMVGGQAHLTRDVPPYVTVDGDSSRIVGLNLVGLRRNGFSREDVAQLKAAYRLIYRSGLRWTEVIEALKAAFPDGPAAALAEFFSGGQRGFVPERRAPPAAALKLHQPTQENTASQRKVG